MNQFFLAIISVLLFSCTNASLEDRQHGGLNRIEVQLIDSFGVITFDSPRRYDTSFSWTHYSDCNTCHEQKYRFQSKINPIIKESGWLVDIPKDSVERFTISHKRYYPFHESDTMKDLASHNNFKRELSFKRRYMKMISDTIYRINDRYFSVFELENADTTNRKEVVALTTINGNYINFSCELVSGKRGSTEHDFFKNSINLINSIVIQNNR